MFTNKASDGTNNLIGNKLRELRKEQGISQRQLSDRLQLLILDVDKNAIQRIESGKRFVTDIELKIISDYFGISVDNMFK